MELTPLENLFQTLTADITGLDPDEGVRVSWPTDGAPSWGIDESIIFLRVVTSDHPYNRQRETKHEYIASPEAFTREVSYTRVTTVTWILYGPNSFANAQLLRDAMFYQENHDILAQSKLFLIPDVSEPKRAPELWEERWWERVDMNMTFNEFITRLTTSQFIKSAEIIVEHVDGSIEINVTQ